MDQMKLALERALGRKVLDQVQSVVARAEPTNCAVCGCPADDHDTSKCQQLVAETKRKLKAGEADG